MDAMTHMTHAQMDSVVNGLSEEEREYLRTLIARVLYCFSKADMQAVLLFGNSTEESISICTVNCEEMAASNIISHANDVMEFTSTQDAPPKEMFN